MSTNAELYAKPISVSDVSECHFYHTTDLPGLGVQAGEWDLRGHFEEYVGRVSFAGKRVLDVGCGTGFLSFSAEKLGAREVVSFDMDDSKRQHWLPFHKKLHYSDPAAFEAQHNKWIQRWRNAYWLTHRLTGSNTKVIYGDVYDIPQAAGQFDVVLVCSILEHLADPIRALASAARVAKSEMVITTPVIETEDKIARFAGDSNRPDVDYVWWIYSIGVLRHVLKMLGFEIISISKASYKFLLTNSLEERTAIVARRVEG
jgi:2-polyprenyl-3-methyl-5-hydroxy-6-metoxy-1,4-benzoquinol methylase